MPFFIIKFLPIFIYPIGLIWILLLIALVLKRNEELIMLPAGDTELLEGDAILYCGTENAHRVLNASLHNEYTLRYVQEGIEEPRTHFAAWLIKRPYLQRRSTKE